MSYRHALALSALLSTALSGSAAAQTIRGHLLEEGTDRPIADGEVVLVSAKGVDVTSALTDSTGFFFIRIAEPGEYMLRGERIGYRAALSPVVWIPEGDIVDVELRLAVNAVLHAPLTVTAKRRPWYEGAKSPVLWQYYERKEYYGTLGLGRFAEGEALERAGAAGDVALALASLTGVHAMPHPTRPGRTALYTRPGTSNCAPIIYLNGTRISDPNRSNLAIGQTGSGENVQDVVVGTAGREPIVIEDFVTVDMLEAVEIYRGASEVPAEFGGPDANCGVIVLWTRRSR
ncbi:MAG: carboxypeptidase-like regulatory domain-containing protein [Gemmatimonadota bacterium]